MGDLCDVLVDEIPHTWRPAEVNSGLQPPPRIKNAASPAARHGRWYVVWGIRRQEKNLLLCLPPLWSLGRRRTHWNHEKERDMWTGWTENQVHLSLPSRVIWGVDFSRRSGFEPEQYTIFVCLRHFETLQVGKSHFKIDLSFDDKSLNSWIFQLCQNSAF